MARLIADPTLVRAAGSLPKVIEEFVGRVNTGDHEISLAVMESPAGWEEPGQTPEFSEYSLVLEGVLRVETKTRTIEVEAGQAVAVAAGEWVRYGTPHGPCRYVAVCCPAFSPETVHRDGG
ncbi:MAG: hypothetical protein KIS66_11030 [Fimbriimonadaceae bacterium]|nr:hypothetical protein [Fimbriimonadaceae bacterium]